MTSLFIMSIVFYTWDGFYADSKSYKSSKRTSEGLSVPCFAPLIPEPIPRQVIIDPDVGNGFPSSSARDARIIVPAFFYTIVERPLYV